MVAAVLVAVTACGGGGGGNDDDDRLNETLQTLPASVLRDATVTYVDHAKLREAAGWPEDVSVDDLGKYKILDLSNAERTAVITELVSLRLWQRAASNGEDDFEVFQIGDEIAIATNDTLVGDLRLPVDVGDAGDLFENIDDSPEDVDGLDWYEGTFDLKNVELARTFLGLQAAAFDDHRLAMAFRDDEAVDTLRDLVDEARPNKPASKDANVRELLSHLEDSAVVTLGALETDPQAALERLDPGAEGEFAELVDEVRDHPEPELVGYGATPRSPERADATVVLVFENEDDADEAADFYDEAFDKTNPISNEPFSADLNVDSITTDGRSVVIAMHPGLRFAQYYVTGMFPPFWKS
jgi:hypothetical protein